MAELEQRILYVYRRLTPEDLQQEKRNATELLDRNTLLLQLLENMDDSLMLVRELRVNPNEETRTAYLGMFRNKIEGAERDLRLIDLVERERAAAAPAHTPSPSPSPNPPKSEAPAGYHAGPMADGGKGTGKGEGEWPPTPQPVLYNITVRSITGVQKEVTVHGA